MKNKIIAYKDLTTDEYFLIGNFKSVEGHNYRQVTKREYIKHTATEHIPNKNEARKLRQLKSKTGLSENEIRSIKKYRKELSDAQKPNDIGWGRAFRGERKFYKNILKSILQKLKLPKEHPVVKKELETALKEMNVTYWYRKPTVSSIINNYKK